MPEPNVRQSIEDFRKGKKDGEGLVPNGRYASFDYCYNYFHRFYEKGITKELAAPDNIEKSCLHLGFYLASWGMLRASSFLLNKSVKHYEPLIKELAKPENRVYWKIDVDSYIENNNIKRLLDFKTVIIEKLQIEDHSNNILVTKVMLGVFGNTPAFDENFVKGMKKTKYPVRTFNEQSLKKIHKFYMDKDNKEDLDKIKIPTFDFIKGKPTKLMYTKAKLIDMAGFQAGQD